MGREMKTQRNIGFSDPPWERVKENAEQEGLTAAALVRQAVRRYLNDEPENEDIEEIYESLENLTKGLDARMNKIEKVANEEDEWFKRLKDLADNLEQIIKENEPVPEIDSRLIDAANGREMMVKAALAYLVDNFRVLKHNHKGTNLYHTSNWEELEDDPILEEL